MALSQCGVGKAGCSEGQDNRDQLSSPPTLTVPFVGLRIVTRAGQEDCVFSRRVGSSAWIRFSVNLTKLPGFPSPLLKTKIHSNQPVPYLKYQRLPAQHFLWGKEPRSCCREGHKRETPRAIAQQLPSLICKPPFVLIPPGLKCPAASF